jgi:hypothetical protein
MKRSVSVGMCSALFISKPITSDAFTSFTSFSPMAPIASKMFSTSVCDAANNSNNPLMKNSGLPLFGEIKADHVVPALEEDIASLKTNFQTFEQQLVDKKADFKLVSSHVACVCLDKCRNDDRCLKCEDV